MIRANLPAAMQGLVVVPLFCGFDHRRNDGRVFKYDVTGGRYEEIAFATTGSGSVHARNWIKAGYRDGMERQDAVDLGLLALFQAADEDAATGGPDLVRRIYPTVATIDANGFEMWTDDAVEARTQELLGEGGSRSEHALLRLAGTGDEGPGRLRPERHRPGPEPGGPRVRRRHRPRGREPLGDAATRSPRSTTGSPSPGSVSTTSSRCLRSPASATPTCGATATRREDVTARALANAYAQTLGQVFTHEMKPYEIEILVAQVGEHAGEPNELFHILYDGTVMDEHAFTVLGGQADAIAEHLQVSYSEGLDLAAAISLGTAALGNPDSRILTAEALEVAILDRNLSRRKFRRLEDDEVTALLPAPA